MALSSMTGFARSHGVSGPYAWGWELKSVNAKGLEMRLRLPSGWDAVETAARAKTAELLSRGISAHLEDVIIDLKARDKRDSTRGTAPLAQAEDALLLDTSDMDIEQAVEAAISFVEKRLRDSNDQHTPD